MLNFDDSAVSYTFAEAYDAMSMRHDVVCKTAFEAPEYELEITMEFELLQKAAALRIEDKPGIPPKDKIGVDELASYQDLVDTVYNVVASRFDVVRERQSNESYSYYIDFKPKTGPVARVRFRIANHGVVGGGDNVSGQMAFKSFSIGGKKYSNLIDLMFAVESLCDDIANGDYSNWNRL